MTPEEYEQYIANLEREAERAIAEWRREQYTKTIICVVFALGVICGIMCFFL